MTAPRNPGRRRFLEGLAASGAFVLAARYLPGSLVAEAQVASFKTTAESSAFSPSLFLGIQPDGRVFIVTHRSEMGTGIRTSLPLVAADELEADWSRVTIEQALGDARYGDQNTDGSRSIRDFYGVFRLAGATARTMLVAAAAAQWNVPASECAARNHEVVHMPSGRTLGYGALAAAAATLPVPTAESVTLKKASDFRYIGKKTTIYDATDIVTGKAQFGHDVFREGMVHASIEHPPVMGGTIASLDDTAALAVPGVSAVLRLDTFTPPYMFKPLGGVAVIANSTWAALQGRRALKVQWQDGPHASFTSETFRQQMMTTARQPGKVAHKVGDVDAAFAKGGTASRRSTHAVGRACADGATGGRGRLQGRRGDGVGADPEPAGGAGDGGRGGRHRQVARHLSCDAARRRLRPQVQARLLRRGGAALEAARHAREGGVDARGRHPLRLLPQHRRGVPQGHGGRARPAHGVAAAVGVPADCRDVRRLGRTRDEHGTGTGLRGSAVRGAEPADGERRRRRARAHRLVPRRRQQLSRLRGAVLR
jgi:hypothetical protein